MAKLRVHVVGAGAWGTALALTAHRAGGQVTLHTRTPEQAHRLGSVRVNSPYLPDVPLPQDMVFTHDPAALAQADVVVMATPAQTLGPTLAALLPYIKPGVPLVLTAKGIEKTTLKLMDQVAQEACQAQGQDHPLAVLSGPSFAVDVAQDLPTAVVIAAQEAAVATRVAQAFLTPTFRPYTSSDVVGVQVGGALKNVMAIAAGVAWGLELGDNARAALLTRGLAELTRLGVAMGGRPETFMGLSGMGDLLLTCCSPKSRNMAYGLQLVQAQGGAEGSTTGSTALAEGIHTAHTMAALAQRYQVDMPIALAVYAFLQGHMTPQAAVQHLMTRPPRAEG